MEMGISHRILLNTIKGLTMTAKEKICVLGYADAKDDINNIRNMVDDLVYFWSLDENLINEFDSEILKIM